MLKCYKELGKEQRNLCINVNININARPLRNADYYNML